jgi:hypothetical protein
VGVVGREEAGDGGGARGEPTATLAGDARGAGDGGTMKSITPTWVGVGMAGVAVRVGVAVGVKAAVGVKVVVRVGVAGGSTGVDDVAVEDLALLGLDGGERMLFER